MSGLGSTAFARAFVQAGRKIQSTLARRAVRVIPDLLAW
jgi:hypothetical protein